LAADNAAWQEKGWAVSDFWFDQSSAFARAWLSPERFHDFCERFEAARRTVVPPRLLVLLDAPIDELSTRVRRRGRDCEQALTAEALERIRRAILEQTLAADVGPVLRLVGDLETIAADAVAALRGME
jgi:deoxyadenosine/deoxycytidine kinase